MASDGSLTKPCIADELTLSESKSSFCIYVVDDNRAIAATVSQILAQEGFDAVPFTDPRLLLERSQEFPPDLVISDIIMPPMNGFDLAQALKETLPRCVVILLTGRAGIDDLRELALEQGLDLEVLSKPLHPVDLIAKVRKVASEKHERCPNAEPHGQ